MWNNIGKYIVTNGNYGSNGIILDNNYVLIAMKVNFDLYCDQCPNYKHLRYALAGLHCSVLDVYNLRSLGNIVDADNNPTLITPSTKGVKYVNTHTNPRNILEDILVMPMQDGSTKAWINPNCHCWN